MWTNLKEETNNQTIIYSKPDDQLWYLIAGLGAFLVAINFLISTDWLWGFTMIGLSAWLIYKQLSRQTLEAIIKLDEKGIQIRSQPFVSWSLASNISIKSDIQKGKYTETLVFVNYGRIQEISLQNINIKGWQLEKQIEYYQQKFMESITIEDEKIDPKNFSI